MRVSFRRFVVDVEVDAAGALTPRPGAAWRSEPATGEASVHREIARLVDGSPRAIAAFASRHGLLRLRGARLVALANSPELRRELIVAAQRLEADLTANRDEVLTGSTGHEDQDAQLARAIAALVGGILGSEPLDVGMLGGAMLSVGSPGSQPLPDPAAFFATLADQLAASRGVARPGRDRAQRVRGLDGLEWAARLLGGLEARPEWEEARGSAEAAIVELLTALPEALLDPRLINEHNAASVPVVEALARETVDDWRETAASLGSWCSAVDLVKRAHLRRRVRPAELADIRELYRQLAGIEAPALTRVELGVRTDPLLRAAVEASLVSAGVWPIRRGPTVGLFGRALVALWRELAEELPPVACATPGCAGVFAPTRNRRYCDLCQAARRARAVRAARAKT